MTLQAGLKKRKLKHPLNNKALNSRSNNDLSWCQTHVTLFYNPHPGDNADNWTPQDLVDSQDSWHPHAQAKPQ